MRSILNRRTRREAQQGGVTILVALVLLAAMTVAALGVSQNTLRDLAITGNESTGRKASEVADSALDWVVIWSNPDANKAINASTDASGNNTSTLVTVPLSGASGIMQTQMGKLLDAIGNQGLRVAAIDPTPNSGPGGGPDSYGNTSDNSGSLRFFLRSVDFTSATAPELFQSTYNGGGNNFMQNTVVAQAFDVEVRYLGESFSNRSSGIRAKKQGGLFLIKSVGRANIGTTGQSFIAQREALVDYTP
jgi:hypothetical protein